jgi:xylulokinase
VAATTITKLRWLHRCEPATAARLGAVALPHDWLTSKLTGRRTTDRGDASGTGWWSPTEERYRLDLLALIDPDRDWLPLLPEVLAPTEPAGTWERAGAVVGPGTGDNMAAAVGLGLRPGDLAISLGTSGTAFGVSERPVVDPTGAVSGFADATGRHLPLVCTLNATKVTAAVARLLGVDLAELDRLALDAEPGAGGLTLVPHLDGERTPNRPEATGTLSGIRSDVAREDLARAAFEGVVCNLLDGADRLGPWLEPDGSSRVLLVGGGARSEAFRQIVADLTGRPVHVPDDPELVARGAAIGAAAVLAGAPVADVADTWPLTATITEPGTHDPAPVRATYRDRAAQGDAGPTHRPRRAP